jgi:hypothetical protein
MYGRLETRHEKAENWREQSISLFPFDYFPFKFTDNMMTDVCVTPLLTVTIVR